MRSCLVSRGFESGEVERGTSVYNALRPHSAAVTSDDTLNRREPYAGAFERLRTVQALEHAEQFMDVLHVETHAIISHEDNDLARLAVGAPDLDLGLCPRGRELDGVGNEIDQRKPQHRAVTMDIGQRADPPNDLALFVSSLDFTHRFSYQLIQADERIPRLGAPY